MLKAVLDRKQPDTDDRGDYDDWQLDGGDTAVAESETQAGHKNGQGRVGQVNPALLAPPSLSRVEWHPIEDDEHQGRQ